MQSWTTTPATQPEGIRTIRVVGRPSKPSSPAAYRAAFINRTRVARELFSENAADMARALGIPVGTYPRYETRNALPHHLIPRFCELTGVPVEWLFRGPRGHALEIALPATRPEA